MYVGLVTIGKNRRVITSLVGIQQTFPVEVARLIELPA